MAFFERFNFWFRGSKEYKAVEELIEESRIDGGYLLLLILSSIIITIGLVVGQISIVIGGMLIAPLLFPILSLGLSFTALNLKGVKRALNGIFVSTITVVAVAFLVANFLEGAEFRGQQILISLSPNFLSFLIAFFSGMAASFAWINEKHSVALPGVAIAVALVPPLCATGIALAINSPAFVENFFLVYLLNLAGVVLSSMLIFSLLGSSKIKKAQEQALERQSKME